jgi:NADPH:quinone reductase-like Zn-dependent oxidoreductase
MRAAVHTRYGPPDVVGVREVPTPTAGTGELLVRVHATTVNRTDCAARVAKPAFMRLVTGLTGPRRTILGNEFAGEVDAVGPGVTAFRPGERVFGYVEGPFGAHAEFLTVPATGSLATIPPDLSYEQAAPATEGAHYALAMIRKTRVGAGQDVLVHGATGAIGSAAVQLLASIGARVTAVCATGHLDLVADLGADRVVDYTATDFTRDRRRYDVVVDAVGKSSFGQCRPLLKPRGTYLSSELGPRAENPFLALATPLLGGRRVAFPIPRHDQAMVAYLRDLLASGELRPLVDRRYPLEEIVEAYRYVETGQKIGNVVITVG